MLWEPGFVLSDANPETRKIRALPSTEAQQSSGVPNKAVKYTDHLTHGDKFHTRKYRQLWRPTQLWSTQYGYDPRCRREVVRAGSQEEVAFHLLEI